MASFNSSDSYQSSSRKEEETSTHTHSRASPPTSLEAPISPPPSTRSIKRRKTHQDDSSSPPNLAAIEAGEARIDDHLSVFSERLSQHIRPCAVGQGDLLSIDDFKDLYRRNQHQHGRHFVVHQHDHPIAGRFCQFSLFLFFQVTRSVFFSIRSRSRVGTVGSSQSHASLRNMTKERMH